MPRPKASVTGSLPGADLLWAARLPHEGRRNAEGAGRAESALGSAGPPVTHEGDRAAVDAVLAHQRAAQPRHDAGLTREPGAEVAPHPPGRRVPPAPGGRHAVGAPRVLRGPRRGGPAPP